MNGIKGKWDRIPKWTKILSMVIMGVLAAIAFGVIFGLVIQLLWNWLMPDIFNLKEITYWQAVGIAILGRLLFGSFGGSSSNSSKSSHKKKKHEECKDEKDKTKGEWKSWKHYDEWWESEGKKAFDEYVDKKNSADE